LEEIVRRHEVLRTHFVAGDGDPVQVVSPDTAFPLPEVDLSGLPGGERQEAALRLATEEAERPFDLARDRMIRGQLLRLDDEEHVLLLTLHHIASDGWSRGILTRELSALYNAFRGG